MRTIKLHFIKHILILFLATSCGVILLAEVQRSIDHNLQIKRLEQIALTITLSLQLELQKLEKIRPLIFNSTDLITYQKNPELLAKKLDKLGRYHVSIYTIFDANNNPMVNFQRQNGFLKKISNPLFDSKNDDNFIEPLEAGESKSGVLLNAGIPMVYSAFQVIDESKNAIKGTLLLGRVLDDEVLKNLGHNIGFDLKLKLRGKDSEDFYYEEALEKLKGINPWIFNERNSGVVDLAYAVKDNLDNVSAFIVPQTKEDFINRRQERNQTLLAVCFATMLVTFLSGVMLFWNSYKTQRKAFADSLQLNYQYLSVANQVESDIIWLDQNLKYIFVNDGYASRFGLEKEDFIGRKIQVIHRSKVFVDYLSEFKRQNLSKFRFSDESLHDFINYSVTKESHTGKILVVGTHLVKSETQISIAS